MEKLKELESKLVDLILTLGINSLSNKSKLKDGCEIAKECLELTKLAIDGGKGKVKNESSNCNLDSVTQRSEQLKQKDWICKDCNGVFYGDNPTCTC